MEATDFDPRYQERKDGPLTQELRSRIGKFRELGSTLAEIGDEIGFSGAFVSQLLNDKHPARVRTIHVPRIIRKLEEAEQSAGIAPKEQGTASPRLSLEDLIKAITAKGFEVTVRARS